MTDQEPDERGVSLTDDLVAGRSCGECVACCKAFRVPQLDKPANVLCRHAAGPGCSIYTTRPDACRAYYCLWRRIGALPEAARPDRLGIIFSFVTGYMPVTPFERLYIIARAIDDTAVFTSAAARAAIGMFVAEGSLPVFIASGEERELIYPDRALRAAILDPHSPQYVHLAPAALAWRKQYGMPETNSGDAIGPDPARRYCYSEVNVSAPADFIDML